VTGIYEAIAGNSHEAQKGLTNRFAGEKITEGFKTEATTTLKTPAANHFLTLYWIGVSSSQENTGEALMTVKVGSQVLYEWYMGNPGAFMHWEPFSGAVGDKLVVELAASQMIAGSFTYSEGVP
jgi:hypothetical protein